MEKADNRPGSEPRIAGHRVVVPMRLPAPERAELSRQLFDVHRQIFAGPSADAFRNLVVECDDTVIQLYLGGDGQIIGYCAVHRFRRTVQERAVIVIRAQAGLLPEYRGRSITYGFGMLRALSERLRHPLTPIYFLGCLVHMSSYHLFCKYFVQLFPHPTRKARPGIEDVARELIESFDEPPVSEADPFVRDVGWVTIETPREAALDRRAKQPDVQFFKTRNPGYTVGHGLVVVVPITVGNLARALLFRLYERIVIALGRPDTDL